MVVWQGMTCKGQVVFVLMERKESGQRSNDDKDRQQVIQF